MNRKVLGYRIFVALAIMIIGCGLFLTSSVVNIGDAALTAIRVAPPAPVFDNAKRLAELAARRKHVAETIGPNSILILFANRLRAAR